MDNEMSFCVHFDWRWRGEVEEGGGDAGLGERFLFERDRAIFRDTYKYITFCGVIVYALAIFWDLP